MSFWGTRPVEADPGALFEKGGARRGQGKAGGSEEMCSGDSVAEYFPRWGAGCCECLLRFAGAMAGVRDTIAEHGRPLSGIPDDCGCGA